MYLSHSGIPGMTYNRFVDEEARNAHFDFEQVIVLDFWVERVKEIGILMVEQSRLGIILEERVAEPSVPELKGLVSFECGFSGRSFENQLSNHAGAHEAFIVPTPKRRFDMGHDGRRRKRFE